MSVSGHLQFDWPKHPGSSAEAAIRAGQFDEALTQLEPLIADDPGNSKLMRIRHEALMGARRFDEAVEVIEQALALKPGNPFYRKLRAIALKDAGRHAEALPLLLEAIRDRPQDVDLLAALCVAQFRVGNLKEALACGQQKLDLLVAMEPLGGEIEVPSEKLAATRNLISFSLWGSAAQYCQGALFNARHVPQILPGWSLRYYVDGSVPTTVIADLRALGAEVVDASSVATPPLMRRFLVHDDPTVARYLVRDCDSRIGSREVAAISAWQSSGLLFHAIRDHPFHHELMHGGLWGGTAVNSFSMAALLDQFRRQFGADHRYGADQFFLGRFVWPAIRGSLLTHDSYYRTPGSVPFPDGSEGSDDDHIGMGIVLR